jgi:hypothetical protein
MARIRNAYKILVGELKEKRSLGRPRCKWEDDIKMEIKEEGIWVWDIFSVQWTGLGIGFRKGAQGHWAVQ